MKTKAKRVVPVRLSDAQCKAISAKIKGVQLMDTSKFIRASIEFALKHKLSDVLIASI